MTVQLDFFDKDPNDILDFVVIWEDWLGNDTIATSSWVVPTGITKDSDTYNSITTTIWLSGGAVGTSYRLTNRIVTAGGRTKDKSIVINILEQ